MITFLTQNDTQRNDYLHAIIHQKLMFLILKQFLFTPGYTHSALLHYHINSTPY